MRNPVMEGRSDNRFLRFWKWAVLGAPVWWLLGFSLFIYHAMAFLLFFTMVYHFQKKPAGIFLPPSFFFLFSLGAIFLFSVLTHAFVYEPMRVAASLYNLSFWAMGLCLIAVMANSFSFSEAASYLKVFPPLAWGFVFFGVAALGSGLAGMRLVLFPTPLYFLTDFLGHTALVEETLTVQLLLSDLFASLTHPRFNALVPYPTAAGAMIMIVLMMLLTRAAMMKKTASPQFLFLFIANFSALLMTLSRTPILAFFVGFIVVFLLKKKHPLLWVFLFFLTLALALPWLDQFIGWLLELRQGSTSARLALYSYSLKQIAGVDWILGQGVKPREESAFSLPIGSHCTYLSLLFRTGVVGGLIFILFQGSLFWRWYRLRSRVVNSPSAFLFWRGLGWVFFGMAICMLTDDIDAPQLLAFIYFSLIGIFEGFARGLEPKFSGKITRVERDG